MSDAGRFLCDPPPEFVGDVSSLSTEEERSDDDAPLEEDTTAADDDLLFDPWSCFLARLLAWLS